MKQPKFEDTVDVLVKAYLNETLEIGNYCACAVGNLIASKIGATFHKTDKVYGSQFNWRNVPFYGGEWYRIDSDSEDFEKGKYLVSKTGYSFSEILLIEHAFEKGGSKYNNLSNSEREFNGLMAVVDVLAEIHGIDLPQKEEAKKLFVKS